MNQIEQSLASSLPILLEVVNRLFVLPLFVEANTVVSVTLHDDSRFFACQRISNQFPQPLGSLIKALQFQFTNPKMHDGLGMW